MTTLSRFEIHQPESALEASQMLTHYGEDAGIYAGGTELLLAMKHQALNYRHLIDLKVVPGLDSIEVRADSLEIGATSTHRSIERSALVRQNQPALAEMCEAQTNTLAAINFAREQVRKAASLRRCMRYAESACSAKRLNVEFTA